MIKSNLSVFSFVTCVFGVRSEKPLSNTLSWRFTPVFSSKIFIIWAFIMEAINSLLFSHFYVVCRRSPIYYFMLGYQVISASFVEKTIILYCIVLAFSVQLPKWRVFSWFLSAVSLIYMFFFIYSLDYCGFAVSFEVSQVLKLSPPSFVFSVFILIRMS